MSATRGLTAKGVPPQPNWMLIIKGVIILFSVIILALAAFAISVTGGYGYYYYGTGAPGFMIFIVIKTLLIFGGLIAVERFAPHLFYRLIAVIAYALSIVFWLSGWAWCASWAAVYLGYGGYYGYYTKQGGALAACAGLGAVTWVLCIVHLVFFVQCCMRNPDGDNAIAGGVAPGAPMNGPYGASNNAELGNMQKQEANVSQQSYPAQQPVYVQPQAPYPAQAPYAAQPQAPYPAQQPYSQ